jgi:hypothetical protein
MWCLAWNNHLHDRIRLVVSIVADADIRAVSEKTVTGEFSVTAPERKMYQVKRVPGVERARAMLVPPATEFR